ncbi:NAD(P)-binding protein [Sporormia fimetaria CBS 119925]|uniref:NAD(P)-binding protein n=1 Tax=Sporormia fimetaria CBS 119925 TaxID=1340428 RepID=A0A6A6VHN6_9PLEO|nr:NAD(P)-binding protein [Sporormia fimetaria CBS 119925]
MRVIVFGASGVQGSHQIPVLARSGHHPVAVSRSPKPLTVDDKEIETFAADFSDQPAIARVLSGADIVFLNLPSTSFNQSEPILAAARLIASESAKAKIKLIVFNTSMPVPKECQDIKAQDDRREIKKILRESGVPTIAIQPVVYLDNLLEGWALPPIRDTQTLVYCHKPSLRVSWICHHDVAQLMVAALSRPELAGRDFDVGGPETVRLEELAQKLSRAWGKELKYENQTVADFCEKISRTMQGRGLDTDRIVKQMFKAYTYYNEAEDEPFRIDMGPVLRELPVELTPIEEWAKMRRVPGW